MASMASQKISGSLWAGAIGDAMGGPLEPFDAEFVRQKFGGGVTTLVDYLAEGPVWYPKGCPKGTYTDDTLMRNILCQAIIKNRGRISAREFGQVFLETIKPQQLYDGKLWLGEAVVFFKLLAGSVNPSSIAYWPEPREVGQSNLPACDAAMMMGPIGLINAGDPRQAYLDALDVGAVLQSGTSVVAAGAVAAATAAAMLPAATPETIFDATLKQLGGETHERIEQAIELAATCASPEEFKSRFYATMLTKVADALEVVPAAFGILRTNNCAAVPSMIHGANFGRDCDTIASIAGTIAGAFEGNVTIPQDWKDLVRAANPGQPDIEQISIGLHHALCAEKERSAARAEFLKSLLSEGENKHA